MQIKASRWDAEGTVVEVVLIVKHGGVLTRSGRAQSEGLGDQFRKTMYIS